MATLCAVLGVRAFPHFPKFFPAMLDALERQPRWPPATAKIITAAIQDAGRKHSSVRSERGGYGLLWTSALSAIATVAASLPSFLSPHLGRVLAIALHPLREEGTVPSSERRQAGDRVLSMLAAGVESRLLVPAVCGAYEGCVELTGDNAAAKAVSRLLTYVQEV